MKKVTLVILICLLMSAVLAGCRARMVEQEQLSQVVAIGNPWSDWESIEEAEKAVGFSFELPAVIDDKCTAVAFRTMNNELMEIIYRDEDREICVRKQKGEDLDISGDYNQYDLCTEEHVGGATIVRYSNENNDAVRQLISFEGYSWSIVAGDEGDSDLDFVSKILGQ